MHRKNWDDGVSYDECKRRIVGAVESSKSNPNRLAKSLIYAIQLRNGSRISEATDALKEFYKGTKRVDVLVRKKKRWKTVRNPLTHKLELVLGENGQKIRLRDDYRDILWPEFIPKPDFRDKVMREEVQRMGKKAAQDACRKLIGVNSHSLRYAWITELSRRGVNDSVIAKISHHSDLKFILNYQQNKEAKRVHKENY